MSSSTGSVIESNHERHHEDVFWRRELPRPAGRARRTTRAGIPDRQRWTSDQLHEQVLFAHGYYPGIAREQLRNRLYFTIDTERTWMPNGQISWRFGLIFLKLNLWDADEFAARRDDPRFVGMRVLIPPSCQRSWHAPAITVYARRCTSRAQWISTTLWQRAWMRSFAAPAPDPSKT